jgi:integrative and conjugative element protein (TIGR02256 family)
MSMAQVKLAWLRGADLAQMEEEASLHVPNETGGVLNGYWVSPDEVVITDIIGAGPDAERTKCGFVPDDAYQTQEIERLYRGSGRIVTYLGEWHTHPGGILKLSATDSSTLRKISRTISARTPTPLMIILAGKVKWTLRLWKYHDSRYFWKQKSEIVEVKLY